MSTIEPDVIDGGRRMDGNSIYTTISKWLQQKKHCMEQQEAQKYIWPFGAMGPTY
jgi:hypothetical protein